MCCQKGSNANAHEERYGLRDRVSRVLRAAGLGIEAPTYVNTTKTEHRDPRTEVRQRMLEIDRTRIRYGYRRVHIMLRREGWSVGRNLIDRF